MALDFANDERASRDAGADPAESPETLPDWLAAALACTSGRDDAPNLLDRRALVTEARRLAAEIRRLFHAVASAQPIPEETIFTINRILDFGPRSSRLVVEAGTLSLQTICQVDERLAVLAPIALAAAELVSHADPARLRRCAADDCGRWFLDTSKGKQRRWCSMARCGNRSKAARYRQRHGFEK